MLFADVVRSMDIAWAVGPERLREIMSDLFDRSATVVQRYGGTVDKFTGDGIMAVFGAPIALEDHALRACMAALEIQAENAKLAAEVNNSDGVELQLRVGLNSGQVITGAIGSTAGGYTAIGEQVGMAQRMESAAPAGGVMLSESSARLVENVVSLGDAELVHIKGMDDPVRAIRLLEIGEHQAGRHSDSPLIGRKWELNTVIALLDEAVGGTGCVVTIVGPPGIGKSRLVRESSAIAAGRGVPVVGTYCESHASDIPFHAVARLLRSGLGIDDEGDAARARVRDRFPDDDLEDLLLFDDLLGIRDPTVTLPAIAADARRRRLTALVNAASLARKDPALYVIEDAHWIDEPSESMLADFLEVIPQTPSLVLITYRPEYRGALSRVAGAQTIALRPLNAAQASALTAQLLGTDPSLSEVAAQVGSRAAGNPFFVEEMVRDLAERGVLHGQRGAYELGGGVADVEVPPTLQATIGARIDRLAPAAKRTLNAAAVIGTRFDAGLLSGIAETVDVPPLIEAQLVEQVRFTPSAEYAFRHPLIRTVTYESQLKSDRAQLHRQLAAVIEARGSADEDAALVAEHLEAAGDLHAAFSWHMRAGTWSTNRNIAAAHTSWRRARQVADRLSEDDPDRLAMRIASRTLLCGSAWRVGGSGAETGFDELRELCTAAGDQRSLAIGMSGLMLAENMNAHPQKASRYATELAELLESIGDSTLTVALLTLVIVAKHGAGEIAETLKFAQRVIDLADGELTKGNLIIGSPLASATAMRGMAGWCMGLSGWKSDLQQAIAMTRALDPMMLAGIVWYVYVIAIPYGMLLPGATALRDTADALVNAEQSGDDLAVNLARTARGIALLHQEGAERESGLDLLAKARENALNERFSLTILPVTDIYTARESIRRGDIDDAITLASEAHNATINQGGSLWTALAAGTLVEALLQRGSRGDLEDAEAAIDRLAALPTDPGYVLHEITVLRLRALLARARGDEVLYRDQRDRYRKMATDLGFEGQMVWAEAMP